MPARFYRLMATDACPQFEPTGHFNWSWFGVAKVEDEAEITRLTKRGCTEITELEYLDAVKKKAASQSALDSFRLVESVAQCAARKAAPTAEPAPAPAPAIADVAKPSPVPRRGSRMAKQ